MALVINNRVRETTSTTGTGAVTLAGAVDGFQTFAAGIGNSNTTYYAISLNTANEWEVGLGTLNSDSSTLTRTTVLESSNSDSAVDFAAGSKEIFCTLPSEKAVYLDASDNQVGGFSSLADDTTPQLGGDLDVNGNAIVSASNGAIAINANGTGTVTMTTNSVTGEVIPGKLEGTNFTKSLLVGHSTSGTLSGAVNNTGVGSTALDALTSGSYNSAVGYHAGTAINSGHYNTAVGAQAGQATTSATSQTYIGSYAGNSATTAGGDCTAVGAFALRYGTAAYNTAVGYKASINQTSGSYNTSIGLEALEGVSSNAHSYNTAVGAKSNELCTTGGYNITLGYTAGDNITSGDGNVIIGNVDAASATDDVQLKISGYDGTTTANWISGESTGNVEINETWNPSLSTTGKALVMGF